MRNSAMGMVCLPVTVAGVALNFVLDTGAKISYIGSEQTSTLMAVDEREDFNPMIGRFSTPIYELETTIADTSFVVKFGNLPSVMSLPLKMIGIDGIIGYDLFAAYTVIMDFKNNILYLAKS